MLMKYCIVFKLLEKEKDRKGTDFHCTGQDIKLALPLK